ncbi:MAG: DUF4251 domain-containing protein [Bacteroidales bacterium]|nr:DUF4251 domain-containing protein [Bacteroidales bacterium]
MRKTIIILATAAMALCGCASMRTTPEEKAMIEANVKDNLDNRTFIIDVDQMNPRRGPVQHVTNYSISVDGDNLVSHLPYVGQAWNLPYGGGKGLSFESKISDYIEYYPKADRRQIAISTNNGEDTLVYIITVFANGKSDIEVRSRNRESISYYGTVNPDRKPQSDK